MDDVVVHRAENPLEHVEEMDPNVRRDPAGLLDVSLPRNKVPAPARRDVGQVNVVFVV